MNVLRELFNFQRAGCESKQTFFMSVVSAIVTISYLNTHKQIGWGAAGKSLHTNVLVKNCFYIHYTMSNKSQPNISLFELLSCIATLGSILDSQLS